MYTWCWANAANSLHGESSADHLLTMNICSLQHIWMSCVLSSSSLFQPLEHWQQWLSFSLHPCHFFFSKNWNRTLWSPTWSECQRDGTVIREQHWFETTMMHTKKWISYELGQSANVCSLPFADVKKHHHLWSARLFMLTLLIKFSLCFDRETRPVKFSLYIQ